MAKWSAMAAEARDRTEEWILSGAAKPRSFAEIESRVELAVATARSSEAAVAEVGAAAIEAAEHARQAAELAERASRAAQAAAERAASAPPARRDENLVAPAAAIPPAANAPAPPAAEAPAAFAHDEWLLQFTLRAERLSERLVRLQHV